MSKRNAPYARTIVLLFVLGPSWLPTAIAAQALRAAAAPTQSHAAQPVSGTTLAQPITSPAGAPQPPQPPPVMTFDPEGISVEDAVRLTLLNDPDIRLQAETLRFHEGVAQEQAGPFDATVLGTVAYDYRIVDLTSDMVNAQQAVRADIASSILSIQNTQATTQTTIDLLEQARNGPLASDSLMTLAKVAPSIAGTLATFDAILAGVSGTARSTLAAARTQFIGGAESTLKQSLTQEEQDLGAARRQLNDLGDTPTQQTSHHFNFNFQLSKPFRNGLSTALFFSGDVQGSNFRGKPLSAELGGTGIPDVYTFNAGANVLVPLGRGRGTLAADALERSSVRERDASQLTLHHQSSASALRTALAYWTLRASQEAVDVAKRSVDLQTQLVSLTQGLIAAGELPQTDLPRAQAAEARSRAQLFESQRSQHQARVALATAMGIAVTGDEATLPRARDPFPDPPPSGDVQPAATYLNHATSLRLDLSAATKREDAASILVQGAATNLRPRVDLNSSTFFTSLGDRTADSLDHWVGPNETVSLQIEKPLGNNLFAGQLDQRRADLAKRRIALTDLTRQIRLNVIEATGSLDDSVEAVRRAELATQFYQSTTDAEIQRFQIGEATLIDTVQTEQQQTDALLALINARLALAQLIAQLRFHTGTLVQGGVVTGRNLTAVPGPASR
jgi:outer membrane protein TolC